MRIGARDVRDGVDGAVFFQRVHRADEQRTRQPSERVFGDDAARRGGGAATRARALGTPAGRGVGCFIVVGRACVVFGRIFVQDVGVARRDVHRGVQVRLRKPVAASRCASDGVRATLAYLSEHRRGVLGRARLDGNVVRVRLRGGARGGCSRADGGDDGEGRATRRKLRRCRPRPRDSPPDRRTRARRVGRETARRRPSARGRVAWLAPDAREGRVTRGSSEGRCVVDARGVLVKLLQICLVRPMQ